MLHKSPPKRITHTPLLPPSLGLRSSVGPNNSSPSPNQTGIIRLELQQQSHLPDLPSFRGHKSLAKDIVEIRRRIKKLDHGAHISRYESSSQGIESQYQDEKLDKYYERLMVEYIKNNPELENTGKRIMVCKPLKVRHQDKIYGEEPPKTASIQDDQTFRDRVSRQLQFRPMRRKQVHNKALQVDEIDDFMQTRVMELKPNTAQTIPLMNASSHKPVFAFASYACVTLDPNSRSSSRPRETMTSLGQRPQPSSCSPKRNDFRLEGWADNREDHQFQSAYLLE